MLHALRVHSLCSQPSRSRKRQLLRAKYLHLIPDLKGVVRLVHEKTGIRLLADLTAADASLLVTAGDEVVFARRQQGIAPLLEAVKTLPQSVLQAASVADTVVGKAAALLLAHADVRFVAARIASAAAEETLRAHGIPFYADLSVKVISGRRAGQPCPFEQAVRDVDDPSDALLIISDTAAELARLGGPVSTDN